jgi:hypothetical protein
MPVLIEADRFALKDAAAAHKVLEARNVWLRHPDHLTRIRRSLP